MQLELSSELVAWPASTQTLFGPFEEHFQKFPFVENMGKGNPNRWHNSQSAATKSKGNKTRVGKIAISICRMNGT